MVVYTKITLTLHNQVKLIEKKEGLCRFKFSSLEETTEAIRLLYHRGADALLDEEAHCITVYDVDDFNIDTVGKDFKLTICF